MEAAQRAYETLSDPERRARYDRTGAADADPNTVEQGALQAIGVFLMQAIEAMAPDPLTHARQGINQRSNSLKAARQLEVGTKALAILADYECARDPDAPAFTSFATFTVAP
jgi:DnaJ-class molecular chaperone